MDEIIIPLELKLKTVPHKSQHQIVDIINITLEKDSRSLYSSKTVHGEKFSKLIQSYLLFLHMKEQRLSYRRTEAQKRFITYPSPGKSNPFISIIPSTSRTVQIPKIETSWSSLKGAGLYTQARELVPSPSTFSLDHLSPGRKLLFLSELMRRSEMYAEVHKGPPRTRCAWSHKWHVQSCTAVQ